MLYRRKGRCLWVTTTAKLFFYKARVASVGKSLILSGPRWFTCTLEIPCGPLESLGYPLMKAFTRPLS